MKRTPIRLEDYASWIFAQLPKGALLSTFKDETSDTMTIGWGGLGEAWNKPVFTILVRQSRYTHKLLEENDCYTVSFPLPGMDVRKILGICGTVSGRTADKFEQCSLKAVPGEKVSSPAIAQLPLTLECRIVYSQDQQLSQLDPKLKNTFYKDGDFHTQYVGEIVAAYILEEE